MPREKEEQSQMPYSGLEALLPLEEKKNKEQGTAESICSSI